MRRRYRSYLWVGILRLAGLLCSVGDGLKRFVVGHVSDAHGCWSEGEGGPSGGVSGDGAQHCNREVIEDGVGKRTGLYVGERVELGTSECMWPSHACSTCMTLLLAIHGCYQA